MRVDNGGGEELTSSTPPKAADLAALRMPVRSCRKPPVAAPAAMEFHGSSCEAVQHHSVRNQIFLLHGLVHEGIIENQRISPLEGFQQEEHTSRMRS